VIRDHEEKKDKEEAHTPRGPTSSMNGVLLRQRDEGEASILGGGEPVDDEDEEYREDDED